MKLTIPIYVRSLKANQFSAWPVFFPVPTDTGDKLEGVLERCESRIRGLLETASKQARLDAMADMAFCPQYTEQTVELRLDLGNKTEKLRMLFMLLRWPGGRLMALAPGLVFYKLGFDVERLEQLPERAEQVISRWLRDFGENAENLLAPLRAVQDEWITTVDIDLGAPPGYVFKPTIEKLAALFGGEVGSGAFELFRVGRCLDRLVTTLQRCVERDHEVALLGQALAAPDRRPVMVVGPSRVGKTALIHEVVARRVEAREKKSAVRNTTHLVAPQRVISGMMYLGQWETRFTGILEYAAEEDLILYFDDVLGLYSAGRTRDSDLCMAHVLKPYIERRRVRILGEITPGALSVLRERDRGLADLFETVRLEETSDVATRRVMLKVMREVERDTRCAFEAESLACILDTQRRYVRDAHFPGKAAAFLRSLGLRHRNLPVGRQQVLDDFSASTGLSLDVLDQRRKLDVREVTAALRADVIGQEPVLRALAECVSTARARLGDSRRPLACLLFVGPTGTGKTQCARSLAAWMFGSEERMVRFNMNEFVDGYAARRLVGTFEQPDGLLTAAVRRQPFCVLLLDEIEKAHASVFNLLLQLMGDGRLTDAVGRTVDFTQCFVILTSNLGSREAAHPLGLRSQDDEAESLVYLRAVENFFSPELFNRLDRVLPFSRLGRTEVRAIAEGLVRRLLRRDGVTRRPCVVHVSDAAVDRIAEEGFHPVLGARALKRAVERAVTVPLAARLAGLPPHDLTLISIDARGGELQLTAEPVRTEACVNGQTPSVDEVRQQLEQLEQALEAARPQGRFSTDDADARGMRYYTAHEQMRRIKAMLRARQDEPALLRHAESPVSAEGPIDWLVDQLNYSHEQMRDEAPHARLAREVTWLRAFLEDDVCVVQLRVRAVGERGRARCEWLLRLYEEVCRERFGWDVERRGGELRIHGAGARRLLAGESGAHVFISSTEGIGVVSVHLDEASDQLGSIVRVYDDNGRALDLRRARLAQPFDAERLRAVMLS
jgi:ATP-dependent Clp protease ATP-binding subunit ClpA